MSLALTDLRTNWFIAGLAGDFARKPVARTVLGVPIVMFRSGSRISALLDRCPHRNAALSLGRIVNGHIECSYHGWRFDGEGSCVAKPGLHGDDCLQTMGVLTFPIVERDGLVWIYPSTGKPPELPPTLYPSLADLKFDSFFWRTSARCSLINGLENLLDPAHPHFIHAGLVRSARKRRLVSVTVRRTSAMVKIDYTADSSPRGLIPTLLERGRSSSHARFFPPSTAQIEYRDESGPRFILTAMFTPESEHQVTIHAVLSTPRKLAPAWLKRIVLLTALSPVLRQDRRILERQQANIDRFGAECFASTPVDLMRPHILHFLKPGTNSPAECYSLKIKI